MFIEIVSFAKGFSKKIVKLQSFALSTRLGDTASKDPATANLILSYIIYPTKEAMAVWEGLVL